MNRSHSRGFTIIELLVVVAIIALLIGILLPAIGKARDQARLTMSLTNLRNLAAAHGSYGAEWNDRQWTLVDDNIGSMGATANAAFTEYRNRNGGINHPPLDLGWGWQRDSQGNPTGVYKHFQWDVEGGHPETQGMVQPIVFANQGVWSGEYFGSWRLNNAAQFNQYVGGRYYDKVFFAPKDTIVIEAVESKGCFEDPGEFCATEAGMITVLQKPLWCSYVLSPAAMFSPSVFRNPNDGGWKNPWTIAGSFRAPSYGQSRYPSLKTHMLEHHWLQARRAECNPAFAGGSYDDCEPYYFNHAWESNPATLFFDGHVETVGVRKAERADGRHQAQAGYGLWSRDTSWGADGYHISTAYDYANTCFHVLTTDGILGRDVTAD